MSANARGPYAKGLERRAQILRVALETFLEGGYHATSIREIADGAGVRESTLFHYFASKEELLLAVLQERDRRTEELVEDDPLSGLALAARDNQMSPELVRLYMVTTAEATAEWHAAHAWAVERYAGARVRLAEQFASRLPPGVDPAWAARVGLALMDGLQIQWLLDPDVDMAADVERFVAMLREGASQHAR